MPHDTLGRKRKPPTEYREYTSGADRATVAALDRMLTMHENAEPVKRSRYLVRQSRITKATRYFSTIRHPDDSGRELTLIPDEFKDTLPAGIETLMGNDALERWRGDAIVRPDSAPDPPRDRRGPPFSPSPRS